MKALNHRKRHVPPGPCGVWFQAQVQLSIQNGNESNNHRNTNGSSGSTRKSQHEFCTRGPGNSQDDQPQRNIVMDEMSLSPAWTAAQQELNLVTPYLPPSIALPDDRHRQLRPYTPSEYALLFEIQRGDHDCLEASISKTILAMVANVESHIHHNIWTVELKDETSSIKAWMEPTLVQQQLRQTNTIIRPGVVWKLDRVGMIFDPQEEHIERMLLIRGSAIQQVWIPELTQSSGQDSPEQQKAFLEWLEKRKSLPLIDMDDDESGEPDCPEDDEADFPDPRNGTETMANVAPRRPTEEEDEDRFEPRNLSGVLGRQMATPIGSGQITQPWSQPLTQQPPWGQTVMEYQPQDPASASVCVQSPNHPSQEENTLTTPECANDTQEEISANLGIKPTMLDTQPSHDLDLSPPPAAPHNSPTHQQSTQDASSRYAPLPKSRLSPQRIATEWTASAPDSSFWHGMLEDHDDDDSESENERPSQLIASQPPTVTTQKEDLISVEPKPANPYVPADGDSDGDGIASCRFGVDAPSMFHNSNVGTMDLNAFDDDDDDE